MARRSRPAGHEQARPGLSGHRAGSSGACAGPWRKRSTPCRSAERCTVCGMLTGTGLSQVWRHDRAHGFFSHARWSAEALGLALAKLIVALLAPDREPGAGGDRGRRADLRFWAGAHRLVAAVHRTVPFTVACQSLAMLACHRRGTIPATWTRTAPDAGPRLRHSPLTWSPSSAASSSQRNIGRFTPGEPTQAEIHTVQRSVGLGRRRRITPEVENYLGFRGFGACLILALALSGGDGAPRYPVGLDYWMGLGGLAGWDHR